MNVLEMYVVLLVVAIVMLFSTTTYYKQVEATDDEMVLFKQNYKLLQTYSHFTSDCNIKFNKRSYNISCGKLNLNYQFTNDVSIKTNYENNTIIFNEVGNVIRAGTIDFKFKNKNYQYSISVMTGTLNEK